MEFRVLGPLDVLDGQRSLPLGGVRRRAVLALLLLNRNELLSAERLVDEVWGERPPPTAGKALQVHVSQLRKVLGERRIVSRPPGYLIAVGDEEIDLARFERGLEDGRAALARGDAHEAGGLLAAALALWRGPPLADLAYEAFAQPEVGRLEELRLTALEEQIEAELACGRHAASVAELERLARVHPLRERLRAQLMLALYRSGRQADALAAYREARRLLSDELGLEPGRQLRELEQAILAQDPALGAPSGGSRPAPAVPVVEERRLVTALVADVGDADPERMLAVLAAVADALREEAGAAGGRIEPATAGSLVAVFGALAAHEDHAERALHAARALRDRFGEGLRIGIESGEVITGGEAVTGPPVRAAARLAAAAGAGEVVVGERARAAARPRGVRGLPRVFVGREEEIALLEATLARVARRGRPELVTVVGDAGVGKTSLVRVLRERSAAAPARWYIGRCPAYGRAITYRPLAEVLRAHLGVGADDPAELVRARLGDRAILGLTVGIEPDDDVHPLDARDQLHDAWVELLAESAAERQTVVVVEDLHWADPALLDLLETAVRRVRGPLLLLGTARPELVEGPAGSGDATRLWLEPLTAAESERMLAQLARDLPAHVRRFVLDRAEGNPLFAEELLQSLIDHGTLRRAGEGWAAAELPRAVTVSDTVQGVLAARIGRLDVGAKQALQAAAVAGASFWAGAVRAMVGESGASLDVLEERSFVARSLGSSLAGEREYAFKHGLTRDVAYASLPAARRAALHAAFGEWLERTGGGDDRHAPLLAHHFARAVAPDQPGELREQAVRWLERAADLAFRRYEMSDAAALYVQGIALADDVATERRLWRGAARARLLRYDMAGFRDAMEAALALSGEPSETAVLYAELAFEGSRPYLWQQPPVGGQVAGWIERALVLAEPESEARAMALQARAFLDPEQEEAAREGAALAERIGDPTLIAHGYEARAHVAHARSRLDETTRFAERQYALLPRITDPDRRQGRCMVAAFAFLRAGRLEEGRSAAAQADAISARLTTHHEVHGAAMQLVADTVACDWDAARARTRRAEAACAANADTPCQFNWRSLLMAALAWAQAGDDAQALRLEELAAEASADGAPLAKEPALLRLALCRGDLAAAERMVAERPAIDFWDADYPAARIDVLAALGDRGRVEAEAPPLIDLGGYVVPFAQRALGVVHEERALIEAAADGFERMGLLGRAAETRGVLGAPR